MSESERTAELNFDSVVPVEVPVKYKGEDYVLCEASGTAAAKYKNAMLQTMKMNDGKVTAMVGMFDSELLLVSLCLFKIVGKDRVPVGIDFVNSIPSRIVRKLYDTAKKISELDQDATLDSLKKQKADLEEKIGKLESGEDMAKNGQEATTDGSV